jgi:beta-glucosidase-like glycosyl hydrolase/CubicO group peptidase (beta-lactamase class C family)
MNQRLSIFLLVWFVVGNTLTTKAQERPAFYNHNKQAWVDSVFNSLSPDERLAQLFMVASYSNKDSAHIKSLEKLIREHKIGGLIFFQGGPVRHATMQNYLQEASEVPLMIAMDAEWGVGMRLDSTIDYPRQMTLGAIQNDELLYDFGEEVARQMKRLGMHINFAPVVDVNSNAKNPVIGTRSFGENKYNVSKKGIAVMKGMQDNRIMACAKHFPGHGDTDSDSHLTLPIIKHSYERIDSLELYPFKETIKAGMSSMMVAHLYIPVLDDTKNQASTLSPKIVNGLLKDSLGFEGLIFTDALNMKGVSKYYGPGEVELMAFLAGNDVMEFAEDVPKAMELIRKKVEEGTVSQADIDARCKKVLEAKAWFGLDAYQPVELKNLTSDLNNSKARAVHNELVANSLTLLINKNAVPVKNLEENIACLVFGDDADNAFQETLSKYAPIDHFQLKKGAEQQQRFNLLSRLKKYDKVILSVHDMSSRRSKNYGVTQDLLDVIAELSFSTELIINVFGNPYSLARIPGLEHANGLLFSYGQTEVSEQMAAQAIMGGIGVSGKLPVTANQKFKEGDGETTKKTRLAYGEPAQVDLNEDLLSKIDSLTLDAIAKKATPGAQVLVAKDGIVVYNKNFGYHTYEGKREVRSDDVYDLASITKIAASLASFMKLVDEGKVSVDDKVSQHLPELKSTNKKDITFRDMLAHFARLTPWIPFYTKTLKDGKLDSTYYKTQGSELFSLQVAESVFIRTDYQDSIYEAINNSELLSKKKYKYSDLGYYYIKKVVEKLSNQSLQDYAASSFYRSLGLETMGFLPLNRIESDRLVPTEYDMVFRKQLIKGHVHDQGAAMLGGVGGHAGLFSNATDLAVLMQMYMNEGEYGGKRYISAETIQEFIKCQFCKDGNRRGIGFDKPEPDGNGGPTCDCVSYLSFGHSGFTGTIAWADPEEDIVYIFLSNRVYPDAENRKLLKMDVRTNIQQVIYDALEEK